MIIDSEISDPLNLQEVKKGLTFTGINNQVYKLLDIGNVQTVRRDAMFSFFAHSEVKYTDIAKVESHLLALWTVKSRLFLFNFKVQGYRVHAKCLNKGISK